MSFNLDGADLTQIDWTDLRLHSIQLRASDLTQAYLSGSELVDADLTGAKLIDAELINCDLSNSVMEYADLRGGANLTGATLKADQLTHVYSGPSPGSGKVTIWPGGLTPPAPRNPDTETKTKTKTSPSQPPPQPHGKATRRYHRTQTSTKIDPT